MARKPEFDPDDPFNPETVQRRVEDAAKAERVRKTFIGYREQLHKVLESLADSSKTDDEVVKLESQISSLLMVLDKLEKRKRVTADTLLDFTAQMRKLGGMIPAPSEVSKDKPASPAAQAKTKTEHRRKEAEDRKWVSNQFDKLSDEIGEDLETFVKRSGGLVSSGVASGTKASVLSILGPGAPLFMAIHDFLDVPNKLKSFLGFGSKAGKGLFHLTTDGFSKLLDKVNFKSEKRTEQAEEAGRVSFVAKMKAITTTSWQRMREAFEERWVKEDVAKDKELSLAKRTAQAMKKGFRGLKGLGGGGMDMTTLAPMAGAAAGLFVGALWNYKDEIGKLFGEAMSSAMEILRTWFADLKAWTASALNKVGVKLDEAKQVVKEKVDDAKKAVKGTVQDLGKLPAQARFLRMKPHLQSAADKYGVDAGLMARMAKHESSFNPLATPGINPATGKKWSSAKGLFQPLDKTWKAFGGAPGQQFDPQANAEFGARYTKHNYLEAKAYLKRDPTDGEVYLNHFMGNAGFQRFMAAAKKSGWNSPAANVLPDAAASNPSVFYSNWKNPAKRTPYTFAQIYRWAHKSMAAGDDYAKQMDRSKATMKTADAPPATLSTPPTSRNTPSQPASTLVSPAPGVSGTPLSSNNIPFMPDDMGLLFGNMRQFVAVG